MAEQFPYRDYWHYHAKDDCARIYPGRKKRCRHARNGDGTYADKRTKWTRHPDDPVEEEKFRSRFGNGNVFRTPQRYRNPERPPNGAPEPFVSDFMMDFDHGESNGETARLDTIAALDLLEKSGIPPENILLTYSGSKGFHIEVDYRVLGVHPHPELHKIYKAMIEGELLSNMNLSSFDGSIYTSRRQWRMINSIHLATGLYKIPIGIEELYLPINAIREMAESPRRDWPFPGPPSHPSPMWNAWFERYMVLIEQEKESSTVRKAEALQEAQNSLRSMAGLPPCVEAALKHGITEEMVKSGAEITRNRATMFLATALKAKGREMETVKSKLLPLAESILRVDKSAPIQQVKSSTISCINTVFNHDYKFNCGLPRKMGFPCLSSCPLHGHRIGKQRRSRSVIEIHGRPHPVGREEKTIEQVREEIPGKALEYLQSPDAGGKILLITAPPGTHKTLGIKKLANELFKEKQMRCIFLRSFRDSALNFQEAEDKEIWFEPIPRLGVKHKSTGEYLIKPLCLFPDEVSELIAKGYLITRHGCGRNDFCRLKPHECSYFRQFKNKKNWIADRSFLFTSYVKSFNYIVIDEDIIDTFVEEITIKSRDIRNFLERHASGTAIGGINEKLSPALKKILRLLDSVLTEPRSHLSPEHPLLTGKILLDEIDGRSQSESLKDLLRAVGIEDREAQDHPVSRSEVKDIPPKFIIPLLDILDFEVFDRPAENALSRISLEWEESRGYPRTIIPVIRLRTRKELPEELEGKPIIILDATGNPDLIKHLFGREVIHYNPHVPMRNQVIQITSALYGRRSLMSEGTLERVLPAIDKSAREEPETLLVTHKPLVEKIYWIIKEGILPSTLAVRHFWSLRGSNEFRNYRQIIILGAPYPDPYGIITLAGALFYDHKGPCDTAIIPNRRDSKTSA
ncbi:MAG: hypothetical protein JRG73_20950 [Deltaproteobacteria bacterium]|nr:hypothetical protein [Deltaproteobacteria bacterium]